MDLKALLIDDDEPTNIFNDIMMQRSGLFSSWKIVDSASAALNYLMESKVVPDVILLDINMPVYSGWDFLDKYAEAPLVNKCDHIIMLTTSASGHDVRKAKNFYAVKDFREKPLSVPVINLIANQVQATRQYI